MILKAYIDESGTHDGSVVTVMAGFVATQEQWTALERDWTFLLRMQGLTHVHAVDLFHTDGEFKGWTVNRKIQFAEALERLCMQYTRFGFAARMANADYERVFIAGNRPKKPQLDSRYGVCFRLCLSFIPKMIDEVIETSGIELHVILEAGHKNAGDARRLYDLFKKQADPALTKAVSSLAFADKKSCIPLQAADIIAYPIFRGEVRGEKDYIDFPDSEDKWAAAREFAKRKAPIFRLDASATQLAELRRTLMLNTGHSLATPAQPTVRAPAAQRVTPSGRKA